MLVVNVVASFITTLHLTPYALHPTSYTMRLTPYALHHAPYTLRPTPYTLHSTPYKGTCGSKEGFL